MSSAQSNISATEELERPGQQNTSRNARSPVAASLARRPQHQVTVRVDEIPQVTASQDANSRELAETIDSVESIEGEETSGNLTDAGSQLNDPALTVREYISRYGTPSDDNPRATERRNPADNEEHSGGLSDDQHSGTFLQNIVPQDAAVEDMDAIHAEIRTGFEQYIRNRFTERLSDSQHVVEAIRFYTQRLNERNGSGTNPASTMEIQEGTPVEMVTIETMDSFYDFYATLSPRQPLVYIEKSYRNQAIDELLTRVLIDETQTEPVLCPICNEKYDSSTEADAFHGACMVPGCKHIFGRGCINRWLKEEKKSTCPMCRAEIEIPTDS